MTTTGSKPLVGPNELIRRIDEFTDAVNWYLIPVIRFVGHKNGVFDETRRRFAGLIHEKRHSGKPAHLVIFDHFPRPLLQDPSPLTADTAYIFCLEDHEELSEQELDFLRNKIALSIINPDPDTLAWHIKALLVLQDLSFSNDHSAFINLLSTDADYRRSLSSMVGAIFNGKSVVASVSSTACRDAVLEFLFGTIPDSYAPLPIKLSAINPPALPDNKLSLIDESDLSCKQLAQLFSSTTSGNTSKPVMAITVNQDISDFPSIDNVITVSIDDLKERHYDAHLIAYWCIAYRSHKNQKVGYFSTERITETLNNCDFAVEEFTHQLSSSSSDSSAPTEILETILDIYDRLSIDDIMSETERSIMIKLRLNTEIVNAASSAAGIPAVTWHKRIRRLHAKSSLISLLSNVRDS